jgi:hypothetical protein
MSYLSLCRAPSYSPTNNPFRWSSLAFTAHLVRSEESDRRCCSTISPNIRTGCCPYHPIKHSCTQNHSWRVRTCCGSSGSINLYCILLWPVEETEWTGCSLAKELTTPHLGLIYSLNKVDADLTTSCSHPHKTSLEPEIPFSLLFSLAYTPVVPH